MKMKNTAGFTLVEIIITVFLISLISTILFSVYDSLNKNIIWTEEEASSIREIDNLLSFINYSFKYLYINSQTKEIIEFESKKDYLNNRKDNIRYYTTYPAQSISNIEIKNQDDIFIIRDLTLNDTIIQTNSIQKFQVDFYRNKIKIERIGADVLKEKRFDNIEINIIINDIEYDLIVKPFILY